MKEIGIDISTHHSKSVDDLPRAFVDALDYVITLCSEEVCPTMSSRARKLHWPHPDPATRDPISEEESLKRFRAARDAILDRLNRFKQELE
jgi:arsenate reductase